MLALGQLRRVVRGEDVLDQRAVRQADRRIGVHPVRAQPFHLGAAFIEFGRAVLRGGVLLAILVLHILLVLN